MADGDINYGLGLDIGQAQGEIAKLKQQLNGLTDNFRNVSTAISGEINRLTSDLSKSLDSLKVGTDRYLRTERRLQSASSQVISREAQGSRGAGSRVAAARIDNAALSQIRNDLRTTADAVNARLADEIVSVFKLKLRGLDEAVAGRLRQAQFASDQSLRNASERYLAARGTIAERRRSDTIFEAENSRAALTSRNRFEQLNYNGGSDLMAIQGRVMANYMVVGTLYDTLRSAAQGVIQLDREFTQFQAISTATNMEMATFKRNLADIAADVPFTLTEMTQAATLLAQAGLSVSEVNDSIRAVAQFATATGSDIAQAVDVVSSALTAFNLETTRTGDVANIFTAALNLSKLSVDKMITALNYIGPTAAEVGLTLEETTSIMGALSQSGLRASTIGTGFRSVLTDLMNPSRDFQKNLRAMGLTLNDVDVRARGFLPVMETLKQAGFGASEAYESFELRAAASFVALQNNLPLAYEMQRAFVLSAAAAEASDLQMTSLYNTAANFGSVMSSLAYTGFQPLLDIFQSVLSSATSVLSVLQDMPGVLNAISIGVAGVGTIVAGSLGLALLNSLTKMIPVLGSIKTGFGAVTTAVAGATTVTGGFSAALAAVSTLISSNWLGLLITGVVAATAAFVAWRNRTSELDATLDRLKGRVNELQGAADATGKKITSIEQAIQDVSNKRRELDSNELMRGAKIDELRAQFSELGLSIDGNVTSVTELIRELHNLHQQSSEIRAAQLGAENKAREQELISLRKRRDALVSPNGEHVLNAYNTVSSLSGQGRNRWLYTQDYHLNQVAQRFGPVVQEAARVALGDLSSVSGDTGALRAKSLSAQLAETIATLRLDDEEGNKANIQFLEQLKAALNPVVAIVTEIASREKELDLSRQAEVAQRVAATPAASQLNQRMERVTKEFNDSFSLIQNSPVTREKKIEALENLNSWLENQTDLAIRAFEREFEGEGETTAFTDAVRNKVGQTSNKARALIIEGQAAIVKQAEKDLSKNQAQFGREASRKMKSISDAISKETLEVAAESLSTYMDETKKSILRIYDTLIENTEDPDKLQSLKEDREAFLEQFSEREEEQANAVLKREQDLLKESLRRQREAIQDNVRALRVQLETAEGQLKRTSPGDAFNQLVQKIRDLHQKLAGELNKIASIDIEIGGLDIGEPISSTVAGSARSAMQHFMQREMSKAGAAAIASNLLVESNFNPRAVGDSGTAYGVAQWRFDRRADLLNFAKGRNAPVSDTGTQYDYVLYELKRDYPELFARLQAGNEDPRVLSRAFMEQYERPNKNPAINHVSRRMREAEVLFGADLSASQAETEKNEQNLQRTMDEANATFIKNQSNATIKNLKARLSNLNLQARINDSAGSIEDIQKQVQDTHAKIMEAELKKFDVENEGTDVSPRRQELQERLRQEMNNDILKIMEQYYAAAEEELNRPVEQAKLRLEAAQQPDVANQYTSLQLQRMQQDVTDKEREASAQRRLLIEQQIAEVRRLAAEAESRYGADSPETVMWRTQENDLVAKSNKLKEKNLALDMARAQQAPTVNQGIQSATKLWMQQNGIVDNENQLIPLAKQVESTWGQVLSGLQSGFSAFFSNIASGTMSAKDAFKQLGQSILQMFTDIIAKALANQIIYSLFGGGNASGSGSFWGGLFGVVGMSTGGIPRAANGHNPAPFRDNVLVNVAPGEGILRKSAMDLIGEDTFTALNNQGNRQMSIGNTSTDQNNQGGGVVNVYVVSEQPQTLSATDVVAIISSDIQRRGTVKQLIKQVQLGAI